MWKYVSRRAKETFEHKCKVLNVHKSGWVCGASQHYRSRLDKGSRDTAVGRQRPDQNADSYIGVVVANRGECDVPYLHYEDWNRTRAKDHNNQQRRNCPISNLLSAITWSGAIVFGWYASQLVCLHRRHAGWEKNKSRYWQMLQSPTRAMHSSLLSHLVLTAPNYPSLVSERVLLEKFASTMSIPEETTPQASQPIDVSNDTTDGYSSASNDSQKQSVGEAVADLVSFLGETEYKMGVKSIAAGQFRQAVAHLKLATSHNHPGATFNLGLCYEKGLGVTKNMKRAMECYQIASSLGHPKAMYNLGVFYAKGLGGLEKDNQAAKKCFITAAQLGQVEAIDALDGYKHRLSSVYDDRKSDMPPMTELIFEKSKGELFAAAAKFT